MEPEGSPPSGNLFVVSGPSGGGKTTLVRALLDREADIRLSVSYTTRAPRHGETEGADYHFIDDARFAAMQEAGEFLEHAYVHGKWYATSARWLEREITAGHDVLLEIDWQGARQIRTLIPSAVRIFILPPSAAILRARLTQRGKDAVTEIDRRLESAREEMRHCGEFDYVIINQDFAAAVDDLGAIVRATRLRAAGQGSRHAALIRSLTAPPVALQPPVPTHGPHNDR